MIIESPHRAPERILTYGDFGTFKTTAWFRILAATPPSVHFYVIDNDQTVLPFLDGEFGEHEDRITWIEAYDWTDYVGFLKEHRDSIKQGDWLVVDQIGRAWDEVQRYYTERVYGEELGEFWTNYISELEANDGKGSKSAFDGNTDWQAIKKMYGSWFNSILRQPGHLYLTTGEKKVNDHLDSQAIKKDFGGGNAKGNKPDGEKTLGYRPRTVLRFHAPERFSTVKDRQRDDKRGVAIDDFATSYLVKVAGWKPVKS